MSKFFATNKDDDSSSSEGSSSSEEETKQTKDTGKKSKAVYKDSDAESSDEERVVVATSDKRTAALQDVFDKMKNHIKIDDFVSLQTDFEGIQSELEKCLGTVFGTDKFQTLPNWVLKAFVSLEDCVNEVTPEIKKKMNKLNAQAYTKVKQKLKKYLAESGDNENLFVTQVEKYRANPPVEEESPTKKKATKGKKKEESSDSDASSDSDSNSDDSSSDGSSSDSAKEKKTAKVEKKKAVKKDDDSDSDSGSSSSSSSSSGSGSSDSDSDSDQDDSDANEDDEEEVLKEGELPKKYAFLALPHEEKTPQQRRWKWVKFECLPEDMKKFIRPPKKEKNTDDDKKKPKEKVKETEEIQEHQLDVIDDRDLDYSKLDNVELILNKYKNQQISRRNFDPELQVTVLNQILVAQATNNNVQVEVLQLLVSTYFASAKNSAAGFFSRETWLTTNTTITSLLKVLQVVKMEDAKKKPAKAESAQPEDDGGDLDLFLSSNNAQIQPALVNFLDKLDQQLNKAFQTLSSTSMEYLLRLRDECLLIEQCDSLMTYLQQFTDPVKVARVGLIKLDHVYYKHDQIYAKTKEALKGKPDKLKEIYFPTGPTEIAVDTLVASIITHCDKKMKIRAILLQVYHHAIHNRFNEARDLLMKARISQIIAKQQISIQIQYNRAIVQIGLAAFRLGMFEECNSILVDVCQSPKLKESLAQGSSNFSRQQEKTLEEEIEEKKRYIPPHLHANLELVDCVYMTTSMLLEVPNLSQNKFTIQKNVINRNFRKLIEQYDLKGIQFAAQNSRDFIVFASRFLSQSKWEECFDNICQIKIFNKMPEFQAGPLKDALKQKIKEVALKIFFLESQNQYESFGIKAVQDQFALDKGPIYKEASKLIVKGEIQAQIDSKSNTVIFGSKDQQVGTLPYNDRKEMEHLQMSHLDKIGEMVENNDRCIELLINQNHYIQTSKDKDKGRDFAR